MALSVLLYIHAHLNKVLSGRVKATHQVKARDH
jgi:hypothetical protein